MSHRPDPVKVLVHALRVGDAALADLLVRRLTRRHRADAATRTVHRLSRWLAARPRE